MKWTEETEIIDALRLQVKIMQIIWKLSKPKASLQPVNNPLSKGHAKAPADTSSPSWTASTKRNVYAYPIVQRIHPIKKRKLFLMQMKTSTIHMKSCRPKLFQKNSKEPLDILPIENHEKPPYFPKKNSSRYWDESSASWEKPQ